MHNIKEAIYENKSKLEGIGEDYQIQVSDDPFFLLNCDSAALTATWNFSSKAAPFARDDPLFPKVSAARSAT